MNKKIIIVLISLIIVIIFVEVYLNSKPTIAPDNTFDNNTIEISESSVDISIKEKVKELLNNIIELGPKESSNPYDYIKDSKEFEELVSLGKEAEDAMFEIFLEKNSNGLKDYIMMLACSKILGVYDEERGTGTDNPRDWFYKYMHYNGDRIDFEIVDADYHLYSNIDKDKLRELPYNTNIANRDEAVSEYILLRNRSSYLDGEKAIEAHEILGEEEIDGIITLYLRIAFSWFEFRNNYFTPVSGGGDIARMKLQKNQQGFYEVLEYKIAMDGGMWERSIREMFPHEIAELALNNIKNFDKELREICKDKAKAYLKTINRVNVEVTDKLGTRESDRNINKAIYLINNMRQEFPYWIGTREILVNTGGKAPGITARCVLETKCDKISESEYIITLSKQWSLNDAKSYWKYKIADNKVELIEKDESGDNRIKTIK